MRSRRDQTAVGGERAKLTMPPPMSSFSADARAHAADLLVHGLREPPRRLARASLKRPSPRGDTAACSDRDAGREGQAVCTLAKRRCPWSLLHVVEGARRNDLQDDAACHVFVSPAAPFAVRGRQVRHARTDRERVLRVRPRSPHYLVASPSAQQKHQPTPVAPPQPRRRACAGCGSSHPGSCRGSPGDSPRPRCTSRADPPRSQPAPRGPSAARRAIA